MRLSSRGRIPGTRDAPRRDRWRYGVALARLLAEGTRVWFDESVFRDRGRATGRAKKLVRSSCLALASSVALASALGCESVEEPPVRDDHVVPARSTRAAPSDLVAEVPEGECAPKPVPDFVPRWVPPQPFHQGVCDAEQTSEIAGCLSILYSTPECNAFAREPSNTACLRCAFFNVEAEDPVAPAPRGALAIHDVWLVSVNFEGCVARTDGDLGEGSCAAAVQAASDCELAACAGCPIEADEQKLADLVRCRVAARSVSCAKYRDRDYCSVDLMNGPSRSCLNNVANLEQSLAHYIKMFCGPPP